MILENDFLIADINKLGAELRSLRSKSSYHEYMWSGDSAYWGKTSPVLFPFVGGLKGDAYRYGGRLYSMGRHGFARDLEFEEERLSSTEAVYVLHDTPKTQESYPFRFKLIIRYRLKGKSISCQYEVYNPDKTQHLLFSLGAHPAFAVGEKNAQIDYDSYYLKFPEDQVLHRHLLEGNLISSKVVDVPLQGNKLKLEHELFNADALVMKNLKSKRIKLASDQTDRGIEFVHHDFPYFGIWAAKGADFVCLEPWDGIADSVSHDQQLQTKEGILSLPPQASWSKGWEVNCF